MTSRRFPAFSALWLLVLSLACATAAPPPASLNQAKSIYQAVASSGGDGRVQAEMARARASIDAAEVAAKQGKDRAAIDALAGQALHDAEAAEAANMRAHDRAVADSLYGRRIAQLMALTQAQRDQLLSQNQLSQAEIVDLRSRNLLAATQADSLRQEVDSLKGLAAAARQQSVRQQDSVRIAQEAAGQVRMADGRRTDSLRMVAERAGREVDSIRQAAARATRAQTEAERLHADSLQRAARRALQEADSLRRVLGRAVSIRDSARIRDSLRTVAEVAARQRDSLRMAAEVVERARLVESERADFARKATLAARVADSIHAAAVSASRSETAAERQRVDSLRRASEIASLQADSLRRSAEAIQRQRDSVQTVAAAAARQIDSLRSAAASATRTRDSLRADVEARLRLSVALTDLARSAPSLRAPAETPRGLVVVVGDGAFTPGDASGGSTVTRAAMRDLQRLAPLIREYAHYHVAVEGHADSTARFERANAVADARARAVRDLLLSGGLDAERVVARGAGQTQPIASNATATGRRSNRRVEIVIAGAAPAP